MLKQWRNVFSSFGIASVILTALVVFGCGGGGGSSSDSGNGGGGGGSTSPDISLSASSIDFGNVVANQSRERLVTVQNTGTANLNISTIASLAAPFSIISDNCSNQAIAPNGSCAVVVRFSPTTQATFDGSLVIPSDDADEPTFTVALGGEGKGLNIAISNVTLNVCPNPTTATVTVTVTESDNDPVTSGALFSAFQNGNPLTITPPINTLPVPISVALALDFSNSLVQNPNIGAPAIQDSAIEFINILKASDNANVYKFAEQIDPTDAASSFILATDPAGKNQLIDAVIRPRNLAGRPTFLFDVLDIIVGKTGLEANNRKSTILVSDGFDNGSTATIDDVIGKANDEGIFIFTIALGQSLDRVVMERVAQETGGQFFIAPTGGDLTASYNQISLILNNQYQFNYNGPIQGGSLNVEVNRGADHGEDTVIIPACP